MGFDFLRLVLNLLSRIWYENITHTIYSSLINSYINIFLIRSMNQRTYLDGMLFLITLDAKYCEFLDQIDLHEKWAHHIFENYILIAVWLIHSQINTTVFPYIVIRVTKVMTGIRLAPEKVSTSISHITPFVLFIIPIFLFYLSWFMHEWM